MGFNHKQTCLAAAISVLSSSAFADNLAEIYELAVKNDTSIRASAATLKADLETENLSRSVLLPQISAAAGYSQSDSDLSGQQSGIPASNTDITTKNWGVQLQQQIINVSAWFDFKAGKMESERARAQFANDQQQLIVDVAQAYFDVLQAEDNLSASESQEKANKRRLEQTQQRYEVGLIAITDVLEAKAAYDSSYALRLGDQGALAVAMERLSVFTGVQQKDIWQLAPDYPITNPEPMESQQWVKFALSNNYAIKAAEAQRDGAHESAKSKEADHYPTLSATIGYQGSNNVTDIHDIPGNYNDYDSKGGSIGLNLSVPIYFGGAISAGSRQAYQQYNVAIEAYAGDRKSVV